MADYTSKYGEHEITVDMIVDVSEYMEGLLNKNSSMTNQEFVVHMVQRAFTHLPPLELIMVQKHAQTMTLTSKLIVTENDRDLWKEEALTAMDQMVQAKKNIEYLGTALATAKANYDHARAAELHAKNDAAYLLKVNENAKSTIQVLNWTVDDLTAKCSKLQIELSTTTKELTLLHSHNQTNNALIEKQRATLTYTETKLAELQAGIEDTKTRHQIEIGVLQLAGKDLIRQRDELRAELARVADDLNDSDATLAKVGHLIDQILESEDEPTKSIPGEPGPGEKAGNAHDVQTPT